jgi:hypothetical protein
MDDRTFLSRILAWDSGSYINVHWHRTGWKSMPGRSCRTIDEVFEAVADLMTKEVDIYFCLSTQREGGGARSKINADKLRSVWMDADVGIDDPKKYPDQATAVKAIYVFCKQIGIPYPSFIVLSGKGAHAYWAADRDLEVEEWQPFANALKAAAKSAGLKIDFGITGDAARVLRIPSTQNWKYGEPLPVVLMSNSSGEQHNFETIFEKILANVPKYIPRRRSRKPIETAEAFKDLPGEVLAQGLEVREVGLLPFDPISAECAWLRDVHETGGANYDNDLWNQSILVATFLQDGHNLAHEFSFNWTGKNGETYSFEETEAKWDIKNDERRRNPRIGWPACKTISEHGAHEHCSKCPRLVMGKSPLHIGLEAIQQEQNYKEMQELGGILPLDLRLPEGFCVEESTGRICAIIHATAKEAGRLMWLINSQIREPQLQLLAEGLGIKFVARTSKIREVEIFLTVIELYADGGLLKKLRGSNIVTNPEKKALEMIEKFATSWLDKLKIEDTPAQRDPGTMGWRYEEGQTIGFAYANKLYHESSEVIPLLNQIDEFGLHYMPMGGREIWLRAAELLLSRKRPELDIIIAAAFASPLTVFAGTLYGPVLVVWGDPGTAKSAAQRVGAAVWGHPKQTRESLNSTAKSVLKRLGLTRNLPSWWDDIQDERHLEALFTTMFIASEGAEGGRLNQDSSYKQRLHWQSILAVCANASFVEYLTRKQKSTTAGMRRVFEIEFHKDARGDAGPGMIDALEASKTFAMLEHNYGVIGMEYAALLGREHKKINELVTDTIKRFSARVQAVGDEQFWVGLCGVLIAGATLARRLGVQFDVERMEGFLADKFKYNRRIRATEGTEAGSYDHTEAALTGFLNHFIGNGNLIATEKLFTNPNRLMNPIIHPNAGHPIYIHISRDQQCIVISRSALRNWLDDNDIRARQVYAGLMEFFGAKEVKLTLGAGTKHAQTQEKCFTMTVKNDDSPLYPFLTTAGQPKFSA